MRIGYFLTKKKGSKIGNTVCGWSFSKISGKKSSQNIWTSWRYLAESI